MKVGLRVKVFSADKREYLGLGTIVGFERLQFGVDVIEVPIIRLDNKRELRGYECWWISKDEADLAEMEAVGKIVFDNKPIKDLPQFLEMLEGEK